MLEYNTTSSDVKILWVEGGIHGGVEWWVLSMIIIS